MPILILNPCSHTHFECDFQVGRQITATAHVGETTATKVVLAEPNAGPLRMKKRKST